MVLEFSFCFIRRQKYIILFYKTNKLLQNINNTLFQLYNMTQNESIIYKSDMNKKAGMITSGL